MLPAFWDGVVHTWYSYVKYHESEKPEKKQKTNNKGLNLTSPRRLDPTPSPRAVNPLILISPRQGNPDATLKATPIDIPDALATRWTSAISMPHRTDGCRVGVVAAFPPGFTAPVSVPGDDVDDGGGVGPGGGDDGECGE